jgi:excinuclease ABC subunit C
MAIKELFSLDKIPQRIEVYDNSHFSGSNQVGVVIVATIDGFLKNHYRKFNLQSNQKIDIALNEIKDQQILLQNHQSQDNFTKIAGDDLSLLYEVLNRRFANKNKDKQEENTKYPDFILIDGGINQLNVAWKVFSQLGININFACISKGEKRNAGEEIFHFYLRDNNNRAVYHNFTLPKNHQLMFYLQRLRDEAHRFAITTHRKKRAKNFITSTLDNIEGIGKVRKKLLLQHFGSINKIADAKINDLIMVKGINKDLASKIISELKK